MGKASVWGDVPTLEGQLTLASARRGRGGVRRGAGRKKRPEGLRGVPHVARPKLARHTPVHVTLRAAKGLPSLRHQAMAHAVGTSIRAMKAAREDFRIVEFSIQSTHLHLLIEVDDQKSLTSGMQSLQARITRRLNHHVLRRKRGRVWGGRYFRRDLKSGRQARNALVYVLQNAHHHGVGLAPCQRDPLSSARWSDRYIDSRELPAETSPCWPARTFLLRVLWEKTHPGPLSPSELPKS